MKELQLSLYEIFGYVIPGMITFAAALMAYWTIFLKIPFSIDAISPFGWWAIAFSAYLMGHLTQALANLGFTKIWASTVDLVLGTTSSLALPPLVIAEAKTLAVTKAKLPSTSQIGASQTFEICDTILQQAGKIDTRDIYVYREGFYRGCFVSCLLLGMMVALRTFCAQSELIISGKILNFTRLEMLFIAGLLIGCSILFFQRFRRFGKYLIANSIYAALVLR